MMETAEEILEEYPDNPKYPNYHASHVINAMKEYAYQVAQQVLNDAAENAVMMRKGKPSGERFRMHPAGVSTIIIDSESITSTPIKYQISKIDDILAYFEDFTHGEMGKEITEVRGILAESPSPGSSKTLEEVKDEVAKQRGYNTWRDFLWDMVQGRLICMIDNVSDKAAELYASQKAAGREWIKFADQKPGHYTTIYVWDKWAGKIFKLFWIPTSNENYEGRTHWMYAPKEELPPPPEEKY